MNGNMQAQCSSACNPISALMSEGEAGKMCNKMHHSNGYSCNRDTHMSARKASPKALAAISLHIRVISKHRKSFY